jgi:hypothetical protein
MGGHIPNGKRSSNPKENYDYLLIKQEDLKKFCQRITDLPCLRGEKVQDFATQALILNACELGSSEWIKENAPLFPSLRIVAYTEKVRMSYSHVVWMATALAAYHQGDRGHCDAFLKFAETQHKDTLMSPLRAIFKYGKSIGKDILDSKHAEHHNPNGLFGNLQDVTAFCSSMIELQKPTRVPSFQDRFRNLCIAADGRQTISASFGPSNEFIQGPRGPVQMMQHRVDFKFGYIANPANKDGR